VDTFWLTVMVREFPPLISAKSWPLESDVSSNVTPFAARFDPPMEVAEVYVAGSKRKEAFGVPTPEPGVPMPVAGEFLVQVRGDVVRLGPGRDEDHLGVRRTGERDQGDQDQETPEPPALGARTRWTYRGRAGDPMHRGLMHMLCE